MSSYNSCNKYLKYLGEVFVIVPVEVKLIPSSNKIGSSVYCIHKDILSL
jgi:hypothetical protein